MTLMYTHGVKEAEQWVHEFLVHLFAELVGFNERVKEQVSFDKRGGELVDFN